MRFLAALPGRIAVAWLVLAAAVAAVVAVVLVPTPDPAGPRSSSGLSDSYESVQVERWQEAQEADEPPVAVIVLSRTDGGTLTDDDRAAAAEATSDLPGATGAVPPPQLSPDGRVGLVPVPLDPALGDEEITETVTELREALRAVGDPLRVQVTGEPAFTADLSAVFDGADVTILVFTAAVVAVLLLITYRSPLLLVVPLLVVAAAEQTVVKLLDVVLPAVGIAGDPATVGIVSVLVFGAATNYALLLIARYREELRVQARPVDAMRTAVERAGTAVLASGGTVVLAVLALLLAATESTQALGVGSALGIVIALVVGLVVLPCALVVLGRAAFWPFVPRLGSADTGGRIWARAGRLVERRPVLVALVGALLVAALALPALSVRTGLSQNEQFRQVPEAVRGTETLAGAFPAGVLEPVVVLTAEEDADAVARAAGDVPGVVSAEVQQAFSGGTARVDVVLDAAPTSPESFDAVTALRAAVQDPSAGGPDTVVGGSVASALDLSDAQTRDRAVIIPVILVAILLVLIGLLRSLVAPVLLLAAVVSTYFAAVGAGWLIFDRVLDLPAIDTPVLLLSFVFLVALGVDYSIFLATRALEEAKTMGTGPGMLRALRVTGGVITSAGILLAAVFAVLGVLPIITLTQIGVIVGIGVLLDTLVVRTLLLPALALLLTERFWWPARVAPARPGSPDPEHPEPATAGSGVRG